MQELEKNFPPEGSEIELGDGFRFNHQLGGRQQFYIPWNVYSKLGRDRVNKKVYPQCFGGSYPIQGEEYKDEFYRVEILVKSLAQIEDFKNKLLEAANLT